MMASSFKVWANGRDPRSFRREDPRNLEQRQLQREATGKLVRELREAGGAQRMQTYCEHVMTQGRCLFKCPNCWLMPDNCACSGWRQVDNKIRVVVHVHHSEWGRSSNTGICIHKTLRNSELLMKGYEEHEMQLKEISDDPSTLKCILWPGEEALFPEDLKRLHADTQLDSIVVIVPDGSYRGARRMASKYDEAMPRVRLSSTSALHGKEESMLAPVRKYHGNPQKNGRVSTLEAVAAFLMEMGEGEDVPRALLENMEGKMEMVLKQKWRPFSKMEAT